MHGKSGISEESIPRSGRTEGRSCGRFRSFPVVFGRFCSLFRSFLVMIPNDSAKSFLFIPFYSSSSSNHPDFMLYNIKKSFISKFPHFFFGGSKYSSYFCQRLQDDSSLSGRATVSPMASQPQAFFMPRKIFFLTGKIIFSNWESRYAQYMAAA